MTIAAQKQKLGNNSNVVSSNQIIQELKSGQQADTSMTISNVVGLTHEPEYDFVGHGSNAKYYVLDNSHASFDVVYSGLKNWSYQDRKIVKIEYKVNLTDNASNSVTYNAYTLNGSHHYATTPSRSAVAIYQDPTNGLDLMGCKADIQVKFYYDDGTLVSFKPGTAYLSAGSLNNFQNTLYTTWNDGGERTTEGYSIEATKVNSGGEAVALYGSSVTVHNGNLLYSDDPNTNPSNKANYPYQTAIYNSHKFYDGRYGKWDFNGSGRQYIGAGLIRLNGSILDITASTLDYGIPSNATYRNWMWWNMSTIIPATPSTKIHYHYNTE